MTDGQRSAEQDAIVGLSGAEAARRLAEGGPNEIGRAAGPAPWQILAAQLANPMVLLLAGAAIVAFALGEAIDALAIGAIVVLNAVVGFVQEYRAERALLALRSMTAPRARVLRDGSPRVIPAAEVVPGDLLLLEAGDVVAADADLTEAHELRTIEAVLTGESLPVDKRVEPAPKGAHLAEQVHRVFAGTAVAAGAGSAVVRATGMGTEMGRIAGLLESAESGRTPLQVQLATVSRRLLVLCLAVVALVAALGLARGEPWLDVLMLSVSLAVAVVPEGLPAVVTIALAIGVQRMVARHVLVRRLPAVETLGATTVVCTDKTGTLTTGRMAVRDVFGADRDAVLDAAAACCDADLPSGVGDPTELAILEAALERGVDRAELEELRPRVEEHPFDPERKRMSIRRADGWLYVKGAVETVLPGCAAGAAGVEREAGLMAERGLRVLAVARGRGTSETEGLECLGLLGLADPPRPEAQAAVQIARGAGIKPVMITGDHPVTARAIARELGILSAGDDPAEVVHARVTPERKLQIVRDWKARGEVVAMTGDGANDAPAIREAHVGVAMGRTGTEVTREAAAVILTDDNFASIVEGVREGRTISDNIRKALVYLLAGNAGEVLLVLTASAVGLPAPLLPLHLLWINLVTDGLPALALVSDPPTPDVMRRPPRDPSAPILGEREWRRVVITGLVEAGVVFVAFAMALEQGVPEARSMAFATIVVSQLLRSFAARSRTQIFWEVGAFTNLWLLGVVMLSVGLQVALFAWPFTRGVFDLAPIGLDGILRAVLLGFVPVSALEITKLARRVLRR